MHNRILVHCTILDIVPKSIVYSVKPYYVYQNAALTMGGGGGWKDNDFKLSTRLILDFLSSQIIQNITGHLSFSKSGNFIELVLGLKFLFSFEAYITQCSAHERHLIKDKFTTKKINLVVFNFLFVSKLLNTSFKQNILRILVLVRDG